MNHLAKRLYDLRTERGLKQDELAEALGVSRQAVSKWEMGTGTPTLENLKAISDYFGVTLDSLVNGDGQTVSTKKSAVQQRDGGLKIGFKIIINAAAISILYLVITLTKNAAINTLLRLFNLGDNYGTTGGIIKLLLFVICGTAYLYALVVIFDKNCCIVSKPSTEYDWRSGAAKAVVLLMYLALSSVIFSVIFNLAGGITGYVGMFVDGFLQILNCVAVYIVMTWSGISAFKFKKLRMPLLAVLVVAALAAGFIELSARIRVEKILISGEADIFLAADVLNYSDNAVNAVNLIKAAVMAVFAVFHGLIRE